jgi:predicted flap endonuclease-1-like 5' DNA nuclease
MKSVKSESNAPEYAQLLGAFDKARTAYKQAKKFEAEAQKQIKDGEKKNVSKFEEVLLKLQLSHAKHHRKALKAFVKIAKLAIKQSLKDAAAETVIEAEPKRRGPKAKAKSETKIAKVEKVEKPEKVKKVKTAKPAAVEATEPKKRGRQAKAVEVAAEAPVAVVAAVEPKKRGRQAKAVEEVTEAPVAVVAAVEPKKRGRQAKAVEVAAETPIETAKAVTRGTIAKKESHSSTPVRAVEPTATEPKKRGRQPKVLTIGEEEEGVAGASARAMLAEPVAKAVKAPKAVKEPKAPKAVKEPKAPKAVKEPKAPKAPKAVKEPKAPKAVKEPKAPKAVKEPKAPKVVKETRPRRSPEEIAAQKAAAEAAAKATFNGADFRIVEGIGPKVTSILHENGIVTFKDLAGMSYDALKALMISSKQYLANPTNWARQAKLAAEGKMAELDALKATLKRGL